MATDGGDGAYVSAKGAPVSFTKSLPVELAPDGVLAKRNLAGFHSYAYVNREWS